MIAIVAAISAVVIVMAATPVGDEFAAAGCSRPPGSGPCWLTRRKAARRSFPGGPPWFSSLRPEASSAGGALGRPGVLAHSLAGVEEVDPHGVGADGHGARDLSRLVAPPAEPEDFLLPGRQGG